ncbi:hypothetical protein [Aquimarina sediminis]|uniref:hypothetical protein n=1 Tax=Aquimarina sediminis TaxID=2070536 RepID=UPI000CA076DA|nr:hypothetical protein [Aquimarina sediminis]
MKIRVTGVVIIGIIAILMGCRKVETKSTENNVETESLPIKVDQQTIKNKKDSIAVIKVPDISGRYDLVEGYGIDPEKIHDYTIYKGILIVNRISDNEFGYVKVIKRHPYSPIGASGIFTFHKNQFYRKEIDHSKNKIYHNLYWKLVQKDSLLGIIEYASNITTYGAWKIADPEANVYISLRKTLKEEEKEYAKFYDKIYHDSEFTGRDEFIEYATGKKHTENDSIFWEKWDRYNKISDSGI